MKAHSAVEMTGRLVLGQHPKGDVIEPSVCSRVVSRLQITAVYEGMLPRQPLRFLFADDPGAGKTSMAGLLIRELNGPGRSEAQPRRLFRKPRRAVVRTISPWLRGSIFVPD